nr:hypothetical protein [uncultured Mediterranean phage uvMED]
MKYKTYWNALDGSEVKAWESPLEEGVFHIPAHSVETKPPKFDSSSKVCSWDGSQWVVSALSEAGSTESPALPRSEEPSDAEEPDPLPETYKDRRQNEYGGSLDQLEFITENGLEAWQSKVSEIKKKYPKE